MSLFDEAIKDIPIVKASPKPASPQTKSFSLPANASLHIHSPLLKQRVHHVLQQIPPDLISGIELKETVFDEQAAPHQSLLQATMSFTELKKEIGRFVYKNNRWNASKKIAHQLLATQKLNIHTVEAVYKTKNHETLMEHINADIFSVYFANSTLSLDEIALALNSFYLKKQADRAYKNMYNITKLLSNVFDSPL